MLWQSLAIENIGALCTLDERVKGPLGVIEDAVILLDGDRIGWLGPKAALPVDVRGIARIDAGGRAVVPGLIDCHTHAIFCGDRADEFARRARGESYAQIMAAGGGIRSTMHKVRAASVDDLVRESAPRLDRALRRGVTTIEVKSGYGLDVESELRMLRAAHELAQRGPQTVVPTLLAAHAVPPEHDAAAYVDVIVRQILPVVAREGLAQFCDVFVEQGAFGVPDARQLLRRAQELGLDVRVHAEQLSHQGGAQLAAELHAVSASHLEFVTQADIDALAKASVVVEVLALAQVFLREQRKIPGRAFVDAGCTVAVATDHNPGTAMSSDLPLAAGLAVTQSGLTADEAIAGMTRGGARALRLNDRGVLRVGMRADLVVLEGKSPYDLVYRWGEDHARVVVSGGVVAVRPA